MKKHLPLLTFFSLLCCVALSGNAAQGRDVYQTTAAEVELLLTHISGHTHGDTHSINPNDVYNQALLIQAEIIALKLHLGIELRPDPIALIAGKSPSHVYQKMTEAHTLLGTMLGEHNKGDD